MLRNFEYDSSSGTPLSGPQMWVRGDDLGSVSSTVSVWTDRSSNGRNLSVAAAGSPWFPVGPTVIDSGVTGFRLASFNGTNQGLASALNPLLPSDDMTIFMVAKANGPGGIFERGNGDAAGDGWSISWGPPGGGIITDTFVSTGWGPDTTLAGEIANGLAAYTLTRERLNSGQIKTYIAGNLRDTVNSTTTNLRSSTTAVLLGITNDGGFAAGWVGELIVYNRLLSPAERNFNDAYLRGVWDLP